MATEKALVFVIRANISDFNKALGDAERNFKKTFGNIQKELKNVMAVSGGIAAAIVAPMVLAVKETAQWAEDIQNLSAKIGMNTEATQRWKAVMEMTGQTGDDMVTIVKKMADNLVAAQEGSKTAIAMFDKLGVSWQSLIGKSPEQQLGILLDALAKMPEGVNKIALATDLLGKGGQKILPALGENWRKLYGDIVVASDGTIEKLAGTQKAMEKLELAWKVAMANIVGASLSGDATKGLDALTTKLNEFSKWVAANPGSAKAITDIALAVAGLAAAVATIAGIAFAIIQINGAITIVVAGFTKVAPAIALALGGVAVGTVVAFGAAIAAVIFLVMQLIDLWKALQNLGALTPGAKLKAGTEELAARGRAMGLGPQYAYAMGGIARSPQLALLGEAGPEAVIPLDRLVGMGGGGSTTVNLNVGNYMGDEISKRALVRDIQRILNEENRRLVHKPTETNFYSVGGHL